jgi:hypothetical protein
MLKGKDIFTFVRFGGLDLKNQKGFSKTPDTYHQPPASRGFYAMPKIAQELFLIGSLDSYQPSSVPKKNYEKRKDWTEEQWNAFNKKYDKAVSLMRKEFRKDTGEIWHHLDEYTDHKDVLQRNGSWIKTDIKVWSKAFSKMSTIMKWGRSKDLGGEIYPRGITGIYSKDHCEVFFDEKV